MCEDTGISYEEPSPNSFSFNSPYGACPTCKGLGSVYKINPEMLNKLKQDSVCAHYKSTTIELMSLVKELAAQSKAVGGGDLHRAESMLIAQAHTLDSIFASLANRASLNMNDGYLDAFERYMRLALKTQGQCRATLETLAAIKNPPVVYARQANIANGPQQVNNGLPDIVTNTRTRAHAREIENQQSKLSGIGNELSSDTRTPALAGGANQAVEAVGAIDRAEVTGGQGAGIAECLQGRDAGAVAGGSAGFGGAG